MRFFKKFSQMQFDFVLGNLGVFVFLNSPYYEQAPCFVNAKVMNQFLKYFLISVKFCTSN